MCHSVNVANQMDRTQLAETLKRLLSEGCKNEQILNAVVLRVFNSLDETEPSKQLVAQLRQCAEQDREYTTVRRLGEELWDDTASADLRFVHRHPKVSYIYELSAYWWRSREILFTKEEEKTFQHRIDTTFEFGAPAISSDPKNVYLDKLVYDLKWCRFTLQQIPELDQWWEANVRVPMLHENILPPGFNCSAIRFSEEKAKHLQMLAQGNKEWSLPGYEDVTQFVGPAKRSKTL